MESVPNDTNSPPKERLTKTPSNNPILYRNVLCHSRRVWCHECILHNDHVTEHHTTDSCKCCCMPATPVYLWHAVASVDSRCLYSSFSTPHHFLQSRPPMFSQHFSYTNSVMCSDERFKFNGKIFWRRMHLQILPALNFTFFPKAVFYRTFVLGVNHVLGILPVASSTTI